MKDFHFFLSSKRGFINKKDKQCKSYLLRLPPLFPEKAMNKTELTLTKCSYSWFKKNAHVKKGRKKNGNWQLCNVIQQYNIMIGHDIYDRFTMEHFPLRQRMTLTTKIYCSGLYIFFN
jgi:hypothetical protein